MVSFSEVIYLVLYAILIFINTTGPPALWSGFFLSAIALAKADMPETDKKTKKCRLSPHFAAGFQRDIKNVSPLDVDLHLFLTRRAGVCI